MKNQAERFAYIRNRTGLSSREFARSLGITPALSSSIETGSRQASRDVLTRLARVYQVNITWYLTGSSETAVPETDSSDAAWIEHVDQEAAAGPGADIEDYPAVTRIPVPRSLIYPYEPSQVRAVTVRGDSMIGKEIYDKDIVVFCPRETGGDGIFVLSVAGTLLVKRILFDPLDNSLELISENPLYPPRTIRGEDLSEVKIEGRVIGCYHRF